ncbi:lysine--tRNA ligase [Treponema primitia ZAS-2]|uniref:Lysine--tRNA ligase n=1 Tax=Treponema primitia (strain ATCC BAA-887 / DSM 12427 / ZAS-2) TaxID=545694 RepID=F5YQI6_TREPZ|nr:lysine--tRNA ligase [Treponema primitia]AEF84958.1 lysine--tRNA ligase [Treponema primitia ZAS-2]
MSKKSNTTEGRGEAGAASQSSAHWADEAAAKILREKGEKEQYTCASGITPSGTVHIGNFREIISVDLVARALRDLGKKVRFIYSWDDYDVFRKIPGNMPKQDELKSCLRFPITMVPDPWERDESYARHHEVDVETILPEVGIHPEYLYQAERYRASRYAGGIRKALEHRDALKSILDKFRDEDHKIQGEWWPLSVFCDKCNKDTTEPDSWDGEWALSYHCESCGHSETVDLRTAKGVKLGWRIDWPMRWEHEQVDFEPAGKDHHSQGGSFDTARHVSKDVYAWDAPVTFRYDFIGTKGVPGKMSSSSGNVIDLRDVLRVYTPELTRYLFAGTRPNTEFTISFDLDVIKIYEDYDRLERIAWKAEEAKDEAAYRKARRIYELSQVASVPPVMPWQIPFRHLCNLIQIADGDIDRALESLANSPGGPKPEQLPGLKERAKRAKYWAENCAPEEFRFRLRTPGDTAGSSALRDTEAAAIRDLRDQVIAVIDQFGDDKSCAEAIYKVAENHQMDGKALFRAAYQALIGKDQGPRLANFLRSIDRSQLLEILQGY